MTEPPTITHPHWWRRHRFLRALHARPRLFIGTLVGLCVWCVLPWCVPVHAPTRAILAWNAGAVLYIALALRMMLTSTPSRMRERARLQDDGRIAVLTLTVLAAIAALVAVVFELSVVRDMHGLARTEHIGLVVLTILSAWSFMQIMFALHYAHDFYAARAHDGSAHCGLEFPGTEQPDYGDFLYFACVIGTSAQTADVSFTSSAMRRVGLLHCMLAFFFNTTVLALTINIASSLF